MKNELTTGAQDAPASVWFEVHPKLEVDLMQHLYNTFCAKYPRVWAASFASEKAVAAWRQDWAAAFDREHITPRDVRAGLECVSTLHPDFPPTEGQFIRCCRRVDPHEAFLEAVDQLRLREEGKDVWSRPAIYWTAVRVGDVRKTPWAHIERRWTAVLMDVLANGPFDPVPAPTKALPAPAPKPALTGEAARLKLAEIRAKLGPAKRVAPPPPPAAPEVPADVLAAELALVRERMAASMAAASKEGEQ